MRVLKWIGMALAALLVVAALGLGLWALVPASTAPIEGENAIAAVERVVLGGAEQTILVRGHDRSKPVLLYLHGGPGLAHLPWGPYYSAELEEQFVVVHWDQRGAGASCEGVDRSSMTLEQVVADTIELSEQLARRFGGGGRIVLLGHSWGSVVGALTVQQRPDLYHAYIGLGQLVHGDRNEELSYEWVLAEAERRGDEEALVELRTISPPYQDNEQLGIQRRLLNSYNGSLYAVDRVRPALWPFLFGPEYTLGTRLAYFGCFTGSLDAMWGDVADVDFLEQIPRLEVPVYFFTGRHDWNTPYPLVEEWAAVLEAPHVEIVWFEASGHVAPLEAPAEFQRRILEKVLPQTTGGEAR
jgi:pimeloyl-ACP methyl ester carboxylesterase